MEEMCERYCDYAIVIGWWSNVFSTCCDLFGMQKFLLNMHMNPELTHAVVERITDFFLEVNRRMFDAVGGKADIFYMWDDIAHQNGLFMKPELWREYFKPSYARLYGLAKKFNLKIMHHICGAIRPLIPELIELGLDILDPVQVRSPGMSPDELKAIYGSKLSFRGAVDVQQTLPFGTADQVREEVRERIRILGEGGGYILASSHTLLMDVPIENILAMYDEANRFRRTE
jgi:uroporphyrinogen decarboxylase